MLGVSSIRSMKGLFIISLVFAMAACGGGGSGGNGGGVSSSSTQNRLVANAGADKTVNAGERVDLKVNVPFVGGASFSLGGSNLEVKGAATKSEEVSTVSWTKVDGPTVSLATSDTTSGNAFFIAPSTGAAKSITITYRLILTTVGGTKSEDLITFTINRVNSAPIVDAGPDLTIDHMSEVDLIGKATDADGTISYYRWEQTAGEQVQLKNAQGARASFQAPYLLEEQNLEFTLTATDDSGEQTKDVVKVQVVPTEAPQVVILFPPTGTFEGPEISAFGTVSGATEPITSVTVTIGSITVNAPLDSDGTWRTSNIPVPQNNPDVEVQAVVTDSNGNTGKALSHLNTTINTTIDAIGVGSFAGITIDSYSKLAYTLETTSQPANICLLSIDLITGKKDRIISSFANSEQGFSAGAITSLTHSGSTVYAGSAPEDTNVTSKIISIETDNGLRSLVSDATRGTGESFGNPTGLVGGWGGQLYVSDNKLSKIFAVDKITGDRTVISDQSSFIYGIEAPSYLATSTYNPHLFMLGNTYNNYILQIDVSKTPVVNDVVTDSTITSQGPKLSVTPRGFAYDQASNSLFTLESSGDVIKVDALTGTRTYLTNLSNARIAFNDQNRLLYLLGGQSTHLFAVDPVTGYKVLVNRDK